jgi:hypothetical protein
MWVLGGSDGAALAAVSRSVSQVTMADGPNILSQKTAESRSLRLACVPARVSSVCVAAVMDADPSPHIELAHSIFDAVERHRVK